MGIVTGYRVIGPNTTDGSLWCWAFPTLEMANSFAKQLCEDTQAVVTVTKLEGVWKPIKPPVEFVSEEQLKANQS